MPFIKLLIATIFIFIITQNNAVFGQNSEENWLTDFEKSNFLESPDYITTMQYFQKLADFSPFAEMKTFGISPQGRELKYIILSKEGCFTPEKARENKNPVLLILNGIHSGEINGKDASMILLREILVTKEKEALLNNVTLIVIPIFSVDAHERRSPYGRINQIGPKEMGWRTTAQNLNLNRDFMKADAPEMQSFLKLFSTWLPDFFIDIHSTDGSDYQYQTTFAIEKHENTTPMIADWVRNFFDPYLVESVNKKGFLISPFVGFVKGDPTNGIYDWIPLPRFSNGYAAVQNRPGLLVESHVLKTYKERVYSSKAIIESVLELLNKSPEKIKNLGRQSDEFILQSYVNGNLEYPLDFSRTEKSEKFLFTGIKTDMVFSEIAGTEVRSFNGKKYELEVPYFNNAVASVKVKVPKYYVIPKEWNIIADRMMVHGVKVDTIKADRKIQAHRYKFRDVEFPKKPYEGRFLPEYKYDEYRELAAVHAGDFMISTNQRSLAVILHLLEPASEDSFIKWGFFNIIFEQKEYYEDYALEPVAQQMIKENPDLLAEFELKIKQDSTFAKNPEARMNWFYERSPYFDQQFNIYPILRVME